MIHLTFPRGNTVCGALDGETTADINHVTCEDCYEMHENWCEEKEYHPFSASPINGKCQACGLEKTHKAHTL